MHQLDVPPEDIVTHLDNLEAILDDLQRHRPLDDRAEHDLKRGAQTCLALSAADLSGDAPALRYLRAAGIEVNQVMLHAIGEACADPFRTTLTTLAAATNGLLHWRVHLAQIYGPLKDQCKKSVLPSCTTGEESSVAEAL